MQKQNFDQDWEYLDRYIGLRFGTDPWQPVHLPHDASIERPRQGDYPTGSGGGYAWSGAVTYQKRFLAPVDWRGQSVQLEFEGVYMNAEVWLNHQLLALHPYGYTSFVVDLAPHLKYGAENLLKVIANNTAQPNSRWYSGTGIYRHVWLRTGGQAHIPVWGVFVTTPVVDPGRCEVQVLTEIANPVPGAVLRSIILDATGAEVARQESPVTGVSVHQTLPVANARLWSVDEPALYRLVSELRVEGRQVDGEQTPFGIRRITMDAENGLLLNGAPLKLKGGCVHHDNGLLGAASYDRAEERKIELMKASGFNAIRCAHNPPAPAMLDACDRLGMLVIDETFDCWRIGKNPGDYHLSFEDWWQRDTESMVRRDRNHPSIFAWSIGNEVAERAGVSDGAAWARQQASLIRSLDSTRPVTSALPFLFEDIFKDPQNKLDIPAGDAWGELTREFCDALDLVGYNYLVERYAEDALRFPGRVIAGTETFPVDAYAYWKETERLPYVIGDFVWTAIDYLGESGIGRVTFEPVTGFGTAYPYHLANCGDIDICGFKRPQSYYRDILWGTRTAPFLAVLEPRRYGQQPYYNHWGWEPVTDSWTFPGQEGQLTRVDVYSAAEEVEVWLNGVSQGRKPAGAASRNAASFTLAYQPGTLEAASYQAGQETGRTRLQTAGEPAALRLSVDRPAIWAAYGDLAYVTVEIVDAAGTRVPYAEALVRLDVTGPGELAAVGTANPISEELYVGNQRQAWQGRLMAVVRSAGPAGEIRLRAQADGMAEEVGIDCK